MSLSEGEGDALQKNLEGINAGFSEWVLDLGISAIAYVFKMSGIGPKEFKDMEEGARREAILRAQKVVFEAIERYQPEGVKRGNVDVALVLRTLKMNHLALANTINTIEDILKC